MDKKSQFFTNYDYIDNPTGPGEGVYKNQKKHKSIKDFLKKNRKRRRKLLRVAQNQFKLDDTLTGLPSQDSTYLNSIPTGGFSGYTPLQPNKNDSIKGLSGDYLLNGQRDYQQDYPVGEKKLDEFINQESHLYGLDREYDIEEVENTYSPSKQKYNLTDLKQDTFKDIKPYP